MKLGKRKMKALTDMRAELMKIQTEQIYYVTDEGWVKPVFRERYLELTKEAKKYSDAIRTLEELMGGAK